MSKIRREEKKKNETIKQFKLKINAYCNKYMTGFLFGHASPCIDLSITTSSHLTHTPTIIFFLMAQGNTKLKLTKKARVTKKQTNLRAAAPLIIKPKKSAAKQVFALKKSVGALNGTEKLIAGRVGHLEIIRGSRRQVEKQEKEAAKKKAAKAAAKS